MYFWCESTVLYVLYCPVYTNIFIQCKKKKTHIFLVMFSPPMSHLINLA